MLRKYTNTKEGVTHPGKTCAASGRERSSPRSSWRPGCNWKACRSTKRPSAASRPGSGWWRIMSCSIWQRFCGCAWKTCLGWINAADMDIRRVFGCRKSGLRHFFEVFIVPLRLRRGQGAMQRNPCYARLFADLPYTPPNPIIASGGQSRAPPVAGGARRKPSEQGSARKASRADAARLLRTALRPPNPQRFFDRLRRRPQKAAAFFCHGKAPYFLL